MSFWLRVLSCGAGGLVGGMRGNDWSGYGMEGEGRVGGGNGGQKVGLGRVVYCALVPLSQRL